jgi:hypothetical protein
MIPALPRTATIVNNFQPCLERPCMAFETGNIPKETLDYLARKQAQRDASMRRGANTFFKMCFKIFALLIVTGFVVIFLVGIFVPTVSHKGTNDNSPTQARANDPALTPPYEPEKIVAQAKHYFADKDYGSALQAIRELKGDDLHRPGVETLFNKASDALLKEALAESRSARKSYADVYERDLLQAGQDVTVRTQGKNADTLSITYVLINRPFVYQLMNDRELNSKWISLGFKTVRLSDGYDKSWSYNPE